MDRELNISMTGAKQIMQAQAVNSTIANANSTGMTRQSTGTLHHG